MIAFASPDGTPTPLMDLIDRVKARNLTINPKTVKQYRVVINLAQQWAQRPLTCEEFFQLETFEQWVQWLSTSPTRQSLALGVTPRLRKPRTVRGKMLTARTLWRLAHRKKLCTQPAPAVADLPTITIRLEDPVAWSVDEMNLILERSLMAPAIGWWTPRHWHSLLASYFVTLERFTALMTCDEEHLAGNVLTVLARTTKDGKPGIHMLPDWLVVEIRSLPRATGHWIPEVTRRKLWQFPYNLETMRRHYKTDILRPAGLPDDSAHLFHCLRRSGVTELVNEVGLDLASRQARHTSPGLTLSRYVSQSKLRATPATEVLGRAIKPPDPPQAS